jgi:hypothetical protein
MIDLLPTSIKQSRTYGRRNNKLLRWNIACILAILGIITIGAAGYFYIDNATKSATKTKAQTEVLITDAKLSEVESEYKSFSDNLKTVVQILSNQVLFSELLQQIGGVTPTGATLNSISLSDSDNALDLDFTTATSSIAPTIQVNLADPSNELFSSADIIQVNCQSATNEKESCNIQLRALFKEDA